MTFEPLLHGGNLNGAIARYGGAVAEWLDLSTGISPCSWPVPPLPEAVWQRLPEQGDDLVDAAAAYYACPPERILPVPGSQHAISRLPRLWQAAEVALPYWGYQEHHRAWRRAGHQCLLYRSQRELLALLERPDLRYVVVINPNNPTTERRDPDDLLSLAETLHRRGGRLLVDEAFIDLAPHCSLASRSHPALVVLRSLGKFFGLAGLRLGFVLGDEIDLAALAMATDPWAVSHPARWVGASALRDAAWQAGQRERLTSLSLRWLQTLRSVLPGLDWSSAGLFQSAPLGARSAETLWDAGARRHLLLRVVGPQSGEAVLRVGLPRERDLEDAARRLRRAAGAAGISGVGD
ncbi:threonine-phosphate decarboxylase CobD [Parahaliea aestuarii]|uniref:threonine-phosphate decarboxylase CobD n=1 Tax=Parahaliea aestuarii TaxID=1852021 RepID=UPI00164F7111|nr:threonine-phosphate decarboxylase CobD [Parahaliea aestuarii]